MLAVSLRKRGPSHLKSPRVSTGTFFSWDALLLLAALLAFPSQTDSFPRYGNLFLDNTQRGTYIHL